MDVCACCNKSASENVRHSGLLPGSLPCCEDNIALEFGVDDIRNNLSGLVIIQEDQQLHNTTASKFSKDDGLESTPDSCTDSLASKKCLVKSATFPNFTKCASPDVSIHQRKKQGMSDVTAEPVVPNGDANSAQLSMHSISSLSPKKLVSAMKGSREKQGKIPHKKLHVKWAPDVYDPVPTSVSHVPTNKPQRHKSDGKKNGKKNKHKSLGKSSRANKGKEKKQGRKYGGSSERGFYPFDDHHTGAISSRERPTSSVDLDIDSPDSLCGSSFLKSSVTKLHFPFAEAT